jgi:hypothetical protein
LLQRREKAAVIATESKHWHPSSQRLAEIWITLFAQTLFDEYQFASRKWWSGGYERL